MFIQGMGYAQKVGYKPEMANHTNKVPYRSVGFRLRILYYSFNMFFTKLYPIFGDFVSQVHDLIPEQVVFGRLKLEVLSPEEIKDHTHHLVGMLVFILGECNHIIQVDKAIVEIEFTQAILY